MPNNANRAVVVYGAYGYTGRFVVAELRNRGWAPIVSGRDAAKLSALGEKEMRSASVDDPNSLDHALDGAAAVINCAGPFASTVGPVIEAALRARIPYLDIAAEVEANLDTFANYPARVREAGIIAVPAMAFFGGLGDLLATAAIGGWSEADEISIAYGLDSWKPTRGTQGATQVSRQRRGGRRLVFADGHFGLRDDEGPRGSWTFPPPLGDQAVMGDFTMADTVTISRHMRARDIRSYMTLAAIKDVVAPDAKPPVIEASGRSSQVFIVEVVARKGREERRAVARGRDIYAVTAPLVVEAAERVLGGSVKATGLLTAGEAFDARDFLAALAPNLAVEISRGEMPLVRAEARR